MLTITKKQGLTKNKQLSKIVKNTKNKQRLCMNNIIYDELLVCKINFKKVMQQIKELLAERPAYQYFRICLQGYKDPDVIFDLNKLSHLERIVDVTEQLRPDYDYDKLLAEHENSLLGAYIAAMQKKRQDPVAAKALEYGVSALLGHEICR